MNLLRVIFCLVFALVIVAHLVDAGKGKHGGKKRKGGKGQPTTKHPANNAFNPKICRTSKAEPGDGKQHHEPTCVSTQIGEIPGFDRMPSAMIIQPADQSKVRAKKTFTIAVRVHNMETGHFSDPAKQYYVSSQELNCNGVIKGHCHVTVQRVTKNQAAPADPRVFAFFKGLDEVAVKGVLSVQVPGGLDKGFYRLCTLCSANTHQPVVMPVAKRGSQDDCIRFCVV